VTLAARLTSGNVNGCHFTSLDLGEPLPSARERGDEFDPGIGADREPLRSGAFRNNNVAMASMGCFAPRKGEDR
jgi:hypothetical protein